LGHINLIRLFDFYLAVAFLVSTSLRVSRYLSIIALVRAVPGRWPHLFNLVKEHGTIFLSWTTVLPGILAFTLSVIHMAACRLVWPQANLTLGDLLVHWQALPIVLVLGGMMLGVDWYATFNFGSLDRELLQKYFDQAEYWLRSWTAPVVRIFTLGYINPRQMVTVEVRKALIEASRLINTTLWWVTVQVGLRVAFGLSLWLTFAWTHTRDQRAPIEELSPAATIHMNVVEAHRER
jgi:hypothetical protein